MACIRPLSIALRVVGLAALLPVVGLSRPEMAGAAGETETSPATYYCVSGLPAGSPWPGKRYDAYPSPQPGLDCYTDENEAYHYANDPFFWCVTDGVDGWQVIAYNYPQRGQTCFWTNYEAAKSLPSMVQEIVPPGGHVDPAGCTVTANAADPQQWGHWYFVRCTTPDQWGNPRIQGAVSYHLVNGIPTVSDGPAPITDLSTWTEPGTPPGWAVTAPPSDSLTSAPVTAATSPTPTTTPTAPGTTSSTPAAGHAAGPPSLLSAQQVIADGYSLLAQGNALLISLAFHRPQQVWVMKFAGACPRTTRPCASDMGTYLKESAIDGKTLSFHAIRFYKPLPVLTGAIPITDAIKAARAALQPADGRIPPRVTSATLVSLATGAYRGHVAWIVDFSDSLASGPGTSTSNVGTVTRITIDARTARVIANS